MPKKRSAAWITLAVLLPLPVLAQTNRIAARIDNNQRISLRGHIHPKALPEFDQGAVDPALVLPRVTVVLQPSPGQQAALDQLLVEQQDSSSANYHRWLTPEEFADRFGASQDDIDKIAAWLHGQLLTVTSVARARNAISFSGSAAAVQQAFGLELHQYLVNGERHFANATEPMIPAALSGIVGAIRGLHDFRMKPASLRRKVVPAAVQPDYTSSTTGNHYLAPEDIATIYNLKPLLANGVDGSGQSLMVVGQTQVRLADIELYRSTFNLPAKDPQLILVPHDTDPGISAGDLGESELDLELAGAAAPNATILFVYSSDVMVSAQYAIDQNLAPVLSMSYGSCEAQNATSDAASLEAMARQANAQGITWFAASGDSGATDCAGSLSSGTGGLSVDMPASIPEVTGIGGTEFVEGGGTYWNQANDANGGSARSYIPETAWNDSVADGSPSASGGGASVFFCSGPGCLSGFSKPSWQVGPGVPADGARDVPDVALAASADHDGFLIYSSDGCGGTRGSTAACRQVVGGTSTGPPTFSGLLALLNQQLVALGTQSAPGLGNINPKLYSLAHSAAAAFHDITTGDNKIDVTCPVRSRTPCTPGIVGFAAGPGYDQVTGLGTVDAAALVTAWTGTSVGPPGGKTTGPAPVITVAGNAASYTQTYAPGMLLTIYGSNLAPGASAASSVPLPAQLDGVSATVNNLIAPLWYVSPGQINLQVPYEIPPNSTATLMLNNNGQTASVSFAVAAVAPGIFSDGNGGIAGNARAETGDTVTLFLTGAGAVSPTVADGAPPASFTPKPVQPVTLTVAGISASIKYVGIPPGLVGVTQINYQVPDNAPLGPQPVVVTVGTVSSPPATLIVGD
jgi:uncharacterized protein (TIGR03437 family)